MALVLYSPATGAFDSSSGNGANVPAGTVQLNILIELRVANELALALANGNNAVSLDGIRSDIVNAM